MRTDPKKKQMSSISEMEAEDMSSNVGPISNSTPSLALGQTGGTKQTFIRMASRLSFKESEISFNKSDINSFSDKKQYIKPASKNRCCRNFCKSSKYLFDPENIFHKLWNVFIMVILIISCFLTPYQLAFYSEKIPEDSRILNLFIEVMFILDIFVIFNSAYQDEYLQVIMDRKVIAKHYLNGWFTIDLIAVVPFEWIIKQVTELNQLVRLARISRLYKLVKLARLLRVFKLVKNHGKIIKIMNDLMKVSLEFERVFFFIFFFFLMCHIVTCLWIMFPLLEKGTSDRDDLEGSWLEPYHDMNYDNDDLYATGFYWTITTITTVGYGDISGVTPSEKIFCTIIMFLGVSSFSYVSGSMTSLLSNYDTQNSALRERMMILDRIMKEFQIPRDLYIECKNNLELNLM